MNRKTFSLVTSLAILSSSLSPTRVAAKDFTYHNINQNLPIKAQLDETKEAEEKIDLPLVTETMPDEDVKDKYTKIIFIPETKKVDGVMQYGKLIDVDGNNIPINKNSSEEENSKSFYVLSSARWSDILNYKEDGRLILPKLVVENNEKDPEKKKIHKFLGWSLKNSIIDPFNSKKYTKVSDIRGGFALEFRSRFENIPYFYGTKISPPYDADGYRIIDFSKKYNRNKFISYSDLSGWKGQFSPNEAQRELADPKAFPSKDIYFYFKKNSGTYYFGDYKPSIVEEKDNTLWYWHYGSAYENIAWDSFEMSDKVKEYKAICINKFFRISDEIDLNKLPLPEGIYVVKLQAEDGYTIEGLDYSRYAVRGRLSLAEVKSIASKPKLIDKNKVQYDGNVSWYDGYKKIDNHSEFKINSDIVLTARPIRDYESENFTAEVKEIEVNKGEDVTIEKLKGGITNLPVNIKDIEIKENVNTSEVGESKVVLKLIFSDTSKKEVEIPVKVIEKISGGTITPIPTINESDIITEEVPYNGVINLLDNIENLPDGAEVEDISEPIDTKKPETYTGKVRVTFKDGSSRILEIPVEVLTPMAEKFPVQNPDKTEVENLENISHTEKSEIEEKVREANPQVASIEVDDRGNVTLIYEDESSNLIKAEDIIILREKTPEEEDPEEKPGEEDNKDPEGTPGEEDEDPEVIPEEGDKDSEDKPGEVGDKDPEEKPGEEDIKKTENKRGSWNDFPIYYVRSHRTPTYKVETKIDYKESEPKVISKKFVIDIKTGAYTLTEEGKTLERAMEVKPILKDGRINLPLRNLAEILDAKVIWNEGIRTASFTRDGLTGLIQIDGKEIVMSNGETIELESKVLNINGRIYLPLVNVGQVFGLTSGNSLDGDDQDIEWDDNDKTVTINIK